MPGPEEQTADMPGAAGQGAEPSALSASQESPAAPTSSGSDGSQQETPNGVATASFVAGILGFTGVGILVAIPLGVLGLIRSRQRRAGKARCWVGIVAALLWAAGLIYVVPHVVKAADPGCTAYKQTALAHYNRAIDDLGARTASTKTIADLRSALAYLDAATAKSRNAEPKSALAKLTSQLRQALADESSGEVPGSVTRALNRAASVADAACGTL